jgi:hypothetical protein
MPGVGVAKCSPSASHPNGPLGGLVPTGYLEVGHRPLGFARRYLSVTAMDDRLAWIRHQLELVVDTRLAVELTIAETLRYNRLADEEERLLRRLATSGHGT